MLAFGRNFLYLVLGAAVAALGCGGGDSTRGQVFTGSGGAAAASGASGGAGAGGVSGSGGAAGFGAVAGQGGFVMADASAGGGGRGGGAGASGAAGAAAAGGSGGADATPGFIYPDSAAGSGAWAAWTGMGGNACTGVGCGLDAAVEADTTCAGEAREGAAITLDVIVVFDTSSSMSCDTADQGCPDNPTGAVSGTSRIGAVRNAINAFVSAPETADIRVGLDVYPPYPSGDQCTFDYSQLNIPIAPAKDNVTTFATVLGGLTPHLNTPTEQVLTGAYTAARAYMTANPGRSVAVVLVTDGMPYACDNDRSGARSAAIAKQAFDGSPSIKTYVVGMGAVATLDAIALAGTGGQTHYIEANADATAKILALLKTVTSTITCDYTIPTGGKVLDYGAVNVKTRVGDAGAVDLFKVDSAAACDARGGWFYDVNPEAGTPTKITLCPQSCDPLKAAQSSSLQVIIGCATMSIH